MDLRALAPAHLLSKVATLAGKGPGKVIAVFGPTPQSCHRAVSHVRAGEPDIPVWLFSTAPVWPETASVCEQVHMRPGAIALFLDAQRHLWRRRVALSVAAWTGESGSWLLRLAPFLVPPCRALLLNRHGDFLPGDCRGVLCHLAASLRDAGQRITDPAAACVANCCAGLCSRLFHRLHGSDPLRVPESAAAPDGVARFVQPLRQWDGEALDRFARGTGSRWILWQQEPGATAPEEDLERLFDRADVFAVSAQSHARGWQKFLMPTAPFRGLQPREASRTMAPLSDAILVDREMLLSLGIPRCRRAGTAWRILFWKAAAAGWRSYSVGRPGGVGEEPCAPAQEISFIARVLADRSLRRLGPREAALSRGNIAFSPNLRSRRAGAAGRLKVLIVSPFLPYPLSHGGAVRIYNLCRALAGRVEFVLIAVREKDEKVDYRRLGEIFRDVYTLDLDRPVRASGDQPRMVDHYRSDSLRALIGEVCREWRPDLMQVEFTQMAAYRECAPGVPAILVEHDLTFSLYRQLAEYKPATEKEAEHRRWLAFERHWLREYEGVWTVSDSDREIAVREGGRAAGRTFTIANGVDTERYAPGDASAEAAEILFVGSFRHLPNLIGFDKLVEEVMPRVWRACPQARLRVVAGLRHEEFWTEFATRNGRGRLDDRVQMHGFVEDLRPLYARASVVAVPLAVSAGTNIKVLEAMACGKAIVSTPVGCAGLGLRHGQEALVCPDWERFADSAAELLGDAALRAELGARARRCAERRFSWDGIAEHAFQSYLELANRSAQAGHPAPSAAFEPAVAM